MWEILQVHHICLILLYRVMKTLLLKKNKDYKARQFSHSNLEAFWTNADAELCRLSAHWHTLFAPSAVFRMCVCSCFFTLWKLTQKLLNLSVRVGKCFVRSRLTLANICFWAVLTVLRVREAMASQYFPARSVLFQKESSGVTYRIPALIYLPRCRCFLAFCEERLTPADNQAHLLAMRKGTLHKSYVEVSWDSVHAHYKAVWVSKMSFWNDVHCE